MSYLEHTLNPSEYEPAAEFSPLPAGEYTARITEDSLRTTNKGGQSLVVKWVISEGAFKGRSILQYLNIVNAVADAENIAKRHLANIAQAVGFTQTLRDTSVLHNKDVTIVVALDKPTADGTVWNKIKAVKPLAAKVEAPKKQMTLEDTVERPAFLDK